MREAGRGGEFKTEEERIRRKGWKKMRKYYGRAEKERMHAGRNNNEVGRFEEKKIKGRLTSGEKIYKGNVE